MLNERGNYDGNIDIWTFINSYMWKIIMVCNQGSMGLVKDHCISSAVSRFIDWNGMYGPDLSGISDFSYCRSGCTD